MKKQITLALITSFAVGLMIFQNCGSNSGGYGGATNDVSSPCAAPATWFPHSQTPKPIENGPSSPFYNINTTTNCDFHLWSWQKFLYLTQTDSNGKPRFENLIQVNNQMQLLGTTLNLIDSSQAGTQTILVDKQGRAIYYSIYMDPVMYGFAKIYTNLFKQQCYTNGKLDAAKLHAKGYDTLNYPVGSFELKVAWIMASSVPTNQLQNFYVTTAKFNGTTVKVAMVGMHIAGRVVNHPELIWATFEHKNAAPTAQWPANILTDSTPNPAQVLSTNDYLFYNANTPLDSCSIVKSKGVVGPFKSIYHLFDHGTQPEYIGITQAAKSQDSTNLVNIDSINTSVFAQLSTSDVWSNYEYFGSIWINPVTAPLTPNDPNIGSLYAANLRGSRALSNIAAETYIQYLGKKAPTPTISFNCFGCHNTVDFNNNNAGYNLALSHLFSNNLSLITKLKTIDQQHLPLAK
ncbi:MAG: hypothetical protein V4538_17180 [Bacteroidota bacterium]